MRYKRAFWGFRPDSLKKDMSVHENIECHVSLNSKLEKDYPEMENVLR